MDLEHLSDHGDVLLTFVATSPFSLQLLSSRQRSCLETEMSGWWLSVAAT